MLSLLLAAFAAMSPQDTHPFSVEDMLAMDRISDPQVSPDGRWVVFAVSATDFDNNKRKSDVWLAAVDGSVVRRLTSHDKSSSSARWMPDGRSILFLSARGGSSQVWQLNFGGGDPTRLTDLPLDVENFAVFPDGRRLALSMSVYPDAATLADSARRAKEQEESKVQARVYDELLFRHWDGWDDGRRSHWFVWTAGGADPVDLMKGMDAHAPTRPFGGTEELDVSPDGKEVVFACKDAGREGAWSTNVDLWSVPADGSAPPRRLTAENPAYDNGPVFSPDGRWLAYLAMQTPQYESDRQRIVLLERPGGARRVLTEAWDRSPGELEWSADGKTIYCTADNVGNHSLFAVDVATGSVRTLVDKGSSGTPRVAGSRILFGFDTLHAPVELYTAAADGSDPRPVTKVNAARVAAARTGAYEQFSFAGAGGDTVYGYLVKPVDFEPGRKYPVAFLIHGGPQGSFGDHFHYRWNPQAFAGAGYAVLMIDFHGSTGYGQAFCDAINNDWGGKPYEDLMKGLDWCLQKYPFLDGTRCAALGASFGGYMINWIAGQTDRFRCLVNHDGNLDERMAYYDTEELWFPEFDHRGTPWEHPEHYTKHNPIDHVGKWKTPMLVIHGGKDFRVVETQGMSTFTALQRRGIPSRFLYFPDENHWVLKPLNSRLWHRTVIGWLDQWCKEGRS
ncbi:MAG: S9 family peptidase [Planctomycetota bacterium]|nr:MAG: S9 family peptidase [Planctomycetota bacterium]